MPLAPNHWEAPKCPDNVTSTFFSAVNLLPKDLRFEHGGAERVSCPGRHLTSVRPCQMNTSLLSSRGTTLFYSFSRLLQSEVHELNWSRLHLSNKHDRSTAATGTSCFAGVQQLSRQTKKKTLRPKTLSTAHKFRDCRKCRSKNRRQVRRSYSITQDCFFFLDLPYSMALSASLAGCPLPVRGTLFFEFSERRRLNSGKVSPDWLETIPFACPWLAGNKSACCFDSAASGSFSAVSSSLSARRPAVSALRSSGSAIGVAGPDARSDKGCAACSGFGSFDEGSGECGNWTIKPQRTQVTLIASRARRKPEINGWMQDRFSCYK